MTISPKELNDFEKLLKNADWSFRRAEGEAYRKGRASVEAVMLAKTVLLDKYPECAFSINFMLKKYRGR